MLRLIFPQNETVKKCYQILVEFGYSHDQLTIEYGHLSTSLNKSPNTIKLGKNSEQSSTHGIKKIEEKLGIELIDANVKGAKNKFLIAKDNSKSVVVLASKYYEAQKGYWFGLRQNQISFLAGASLSFLALVCGGSSMIYLQKWDDFKNRLAQLNTTGKGNKMYYHIKLFERNSDVILGLPEVKKGEVVNDYFI
jgi:hypothetical protein